MTEPTLVIMAAGMGSRFGGLKQVAPVDRAGHPILAFSLYDAWRAGLSPGGLCNQAGAGNGVPGAVGRHAEERFQVLYVFQDLDRPAGGLPSAGGACKALGHRSCCGLLSGVVTGSLCSDQR